MCGDGEDSFAPFPMGSSSTNTSQSIIFLGQNEYVILSHVGFFFCQNLKLVGSQDQVNIGTEPKALNPEWMKNPLATTGRLYLLFSTVSLLWLMTKKTVSFPIDKKEVSVFLDHNKELSSSFHIKWCSCIPCFHVCDFWLGHSS